ncbi:hypothetical protein [Maribacter antarcticus]|uniref:hypothetical protein n=1 Tax=Maribacter antarcticus TaxID=505250 RepID=UPI00047C8F7E|nr:hypothetical protein [Maribacter antarcticus]
MDKVVITLIIILCFGAVHAQKPVVTDEFDRFLVTKQTKVGDVIGQIELVEPNPNPTSWSLVKPIPGGDRRNYLKEGQSDATKIVEIDANTAEIKLKKKPLINPGHYYAEVRATNVDGFMEQVLIIIVKEEKPKLEDALRIFTQKREAGGMKFYATETVDKEKIDYAANISRALLLKDRQGSGLITEQMKKTNAGMTLFKTFEERNTAIGFYMYQSEVGVQTQDLEDEEIIPSYIRLGGPRDLRRDASAEEITHMIHRGGIMKVYPGVQKRLEAATKVAVERGFYQPQDGLPIEDYADEYLAFGVDINYGVLSHRSFEGKRLTPENLQEMDSELYDILHFLFPNRVEFFKAMGW